MLIHITFFIWFNNPFFLLKTSLHVSRSVILIIIKDSCLNYHIRVIKKKNPFWIKNIEVIILFHNHNDNNNHLRKKNWCLPWGLLSSLSHKRNCELWIVDSIFVINYHIFIQTKFLMIILRKLFDVLSFFRIVICMFYLYLPFFTLSLPFTKNHISMKSQYQREYRCYCWGEELNHRRIFLIDMQFQFPTFFLMPASITNIFVR